MACERTSSRLRRINGSKVRPHSPHRQSPTRTPPAVKYCTVDSERARLTANLNVSSDSIKQTAPALQTNKIQCLVQHLFQGGPQIQKARHGRYNPVDRAKLLVSFLEFFLRAGKSRYVRAYA